MDEPPAAVHRGSGTFAALAFPNYRLWFFGQMTSLFGTWMQSTAQGYLVFELTRSERYLGYVGFASGIAAWLFLLYGGAVADRIPRRSLLVVTQALSMLLALILAALTFLRVVAPWHIIVLAFSLGVVNAFDAPARQSFVLEMVDRRFLTNAIALNSTMFNTAMVVGPVRGRARLRLVRSRVVLRHQRLVLRGGDRGAPRHEAARLDAAGARGRTRSRRSAPGCARWRSDRRILGIMCLLGAVSLFGMSFVTLIPAWAVHVLKGDATHQRVPPVRARHRRAGRGARDRHLAPRRSRGSASCWPPRLVLPVLLSCSP